MKIVIIGDIIIDINHNVETTRMAAEANIPVYNILSTEYILGGASNVAKNLKNIDCDVEIISVFGNDYNGQKIIQLFEEINLKNCIFFDEKRSTTQKYRLFQNNKLINRHDIETTNDIDIYYQDEILKYLYLIDKVDAIIISDYNKGVVTKRLCEETINYANNNNIYTFIDPKIKDFIKYKNCFCFKPNLLEGTIISGKINKEDILSYLKENINCKNIILTCSEDGLYINEIENHIRHKNKLDVIDVTGCGDVVLSIIVYIFLLKKDIILAGQIANYIAGKSLQKIGNYCISKKDIESYIHPIIYESETECINLIRSQNNKIIFTNGCFDVIHSAHIKLLQYCKKQDGILVVGINSDESVKKLKGCSRPINCIKERCELLQNLNIIDYIIIFDSNNPIGILKLLRPNIMVKGGDYTKENILGKEYTDKILIYNYIPELSSTITINKIKETVCDKNT